jgi:ATP/ADP translocase
MKNFAIKLVWFTTIYVFVFAGLCKTNVPLPLIMGLHLIGFILIPFMVYTVLRDNYKTTKTFKDWYEDHPMKTLDEEEN